jgi:hypothetical protein
VHCGRALPIFPLIFHLDLRRMEDEAPDLLDRVLDAETEAARTAGVAGCAVYALFRRRPGPATGR